MPRYRTVKVMVPNGRRTPAPSIPYLEVRTVSRSKRPLHSNAMPFRGHDHRRGCCDFSSGAATAL
jgi:hypothetical protein